MSTDSFNVIVIGAGPAGDVAAGRFVLRTEQAVIERGASQERPSQCAATWTLRLLEENGL